MGGTQDLCEFIIGLTAGKMSGELLDLAKLRALDTLGAAIYGSSRDWSRIVAARGRSFGCASRCSVVAADWKTVPEIASWVNGTMSHGFELDDVHEESLLHPGAVVVPAAMAVAEAEQRSGEEFLLAVIAGYEVMNRVGLAVGSVSHILRGFHPTGTNGVFGAAAAAARLLQSSVEQMVHAMGIAGSFAGGLMEFSQTGGMIKRLHAGRAAESGVLAAYLARDGFTGPSSVLEGKYGYCRVFTDAPEIHYLTEDLGTRYTIREITVKPYACCSDLHPTIEALTEIKERHGIDPARVEHVLVEGTTKLVEQNNLNGTTSLMAAQFSIPFTVAATLLYDIQDPQTYREEVLASPAVRALCARVELRKDDAMDQLYPQELGSRVTVRLQGGEQHSVVVYNAKGSPKNPMSAAEIREKFLQLCSGILPDGRPEQILDVLGHLEKVPDIRNLTHLLGK